MELSRIEEFVVSKWRVDKNTRVLRSDVKRFLKFFREKIKNECCWRRIKCDFIQFNLNREMTVKNRCALSYSTHCMRFIQTAGMEKGWSSYESKLMKTFDLSESRRKFKRFYLSDSTISGKPSKFVYRYLYQTRKNEVDGYENFYSFASVDSCTCKQQEKLYFDRMLHYKDAGSLIEPPMCAEILRDYMISVDELKSIDIKKVLFKYLVPYASILPIFSNLSHSLINELNRELDSSTVNGLSLGIELIEEFSLIRECYKLNRTYRDVVSKFFISGGLISKLLNQVTEFNDIDIYIEDVDLMRFFHSCQRFLGSDYCVWVISFKQQYDTKCQQKIWYTISLRRECKFYILMNRLLQKAFHPPQIIVYTRKSWRELNCLNQNRAHWTYDNLDNLMTDCYNILESFDIPMCRNAILFLNNNSYYKDNNNKSKVCERKEINEKYFDKFNSHSIKIKFQSEIEAEIEEEKKILDEWFTAGPTIRDYFKYPYSVVGIAYQSGKFVKLCSKKRYLSQVVEIRKERRKKYLKRCKLNVNKKKDQLNYVVPKLQHLAYFACQLNNSKCFSNCLCNFTEFVRNYKPFHNKTTYSFNFITAATLNNISIKR